MIVSLDFDGTLVRTDNFPIFDPTPLPGLFEALSWMKKHLDAKFILLTQRDHDHVYNPILGKVVWKTRSNSIQSSVLQTAINWCKDNGIELYAVNDNPSQNSWSTSRKVYSDLIIDDKSLLPLDENGCVDWFKTLNIIKERYDGE